MKKKFLLLFLLLGVLLAFFAFKSIYFKNDSKPHVIVDVNGILKKGFNESSIGSKIDDYSKAIANIPPTQKDNGKVWDKKNSFKIILFNSLVTNKAIIKNDISQCDNSIADDDPNNSNICKGKYFMAKLIKEKKPEICDNFKNDNFYGYIFASYLGNKEVCEKFYSLLTKKDYTKSDVSKFVDDLKCEAPNLMYNSILSILSKENHCKENDTVGSKLTCYQFLYLDSFESKLNSEIMPDVLTSKYLRGNQNKQ